MGLTFGLILTLVCVSGVLAVLVPELEWATQSDLRIAAEGEVRWDATHDALKRAYPNHAVSSIERLADAGFDGIAWQAHLTGPDGGWIKARVDPYAGEVVRVGKRLYLDDYVRQLHYNFFSSWGFYLVCLVGVPLVLSVLSGLLFHRRWWRSLFFLRVGKGPHAFWSSLHRCLGVWSAVFGFLIGITGLWYLVEAEFVPYEIAYPSTPTVAAAKMADHGPTPTRPSIAAYVESAKAAFPGLTPTGVSLPRAPDETVVVQGNAGAPFVRDRANAVFLDPYDAEVVDVRRSERMRALSWWVNAADPLHFGYIGGLATKLVWATFGLALPAITLSGAYLSWRRGRTRAPKAAKARPTPRPPKPRRRPIPLRSMLLVPLIGALAWACVEGYDERQTSAPSMSYIGSRAIGPWQVTLWRVAAGPRDDETTDDKTTYVLRFDAGGDKLANFKSARVTRTIADRTVDTRLTRVGSGLVARVRLPEPQDLPKRSRALTIEVNGWRGQHWTANFDSLIAADRNGISSSADTPAVREHRHGPAGPTVFYAVLGILAAVYTLVLLAWLVLDTRTGHARRSNSKTRFKPSA